MGIVITPHESRALYGMLANRSGDIVLKTDREGFILHATAEIAQLGFPLEAMLIGPHLLDLVGPSHRVEVEGELRMALLGSPSGRWIEFPAPRGRREGRRTKQWYEIQLCGLCGNDGAPYGALGILRGITERKALEERLFTSEMTDPLTGLTNRRAFIAMLQYLVEQRTGGSLALFDIDRFRSINMRHGQSAGDRVLEVFAELLRAMTRRDDIISRVGDECLAVLFPGSAPERAEDTCRRIVGTLAGIGDEAGPGALAFTASAGIARIGTSLDETIRRAELALILARAKGGGQLEIDGAPGYRWEAAA